MSHRVSAADLPTISEPPLPAEQREEFSQRAFEYALETHPLDNRRRYESFRDTFVEVRPKPPKPGMPFIHGDEAGVCRVTESHLRAHFPEAFKKHGELKVRLALMDRLQEMEKIRVEGRPEVKKVKAVKDWFPGN